MKDNNNKPPRRSQRRIDQQKNKQQHQSLNNSYTNNEMEFDNSNGSQQIQQIMMNQNQQLLQDQIINQQQQPQQIVNNQQQIQQNQRIEFEQTNQIEQDNQMINFSSKRFLEKIPNRSVMRDFFTNKGKELVPSMKDLTGKFCRQVLGGKKKLLKLKDVIWVDEVPQWSEFTSKHLWNKIKAKKQYNIYFPDYSNSQLPSRKYLLNVINTVDPNSIVNGVYQVRKLREQDLVEEAPISMTNEYANLFNQFQLISNNKKKSGLNLVDPDSFDQCPICLMPIRKHKGHRQCVSRYNKSELVKQSQFKCPLRCK